VLEGDKVVSFIEKPDPSKARSRTISTGIYIIDKDIGEQLPEKEAFSFEREFLHEYAKKGRIYAQRMEMFLTVNDMKQYKEAEEKLRRINLDSTT
jgi:NDP-sugar pyrophosphorylase family protein